MIPVIVKLGPIPINSFGLMMVLGFLAAWRLFAVSLSEAGRSVEIAERITFWAAFGGILGGRAAYLLSFPSEVARDPLAAIFSSGGFVFYGGFLGGALAVFFVLKREKLPVLTIADLVAPALSLGYAVGRVGCQLSGDGDYGRASGLPWAIGYPLGVVPTPSGLTVHPTPVYETLAALVVAFVLLKLQRSKFFRAEGQLFGCYLVFSSACRFAVEFVRVEPIVFSGFTQAQIEAAMLVLAGLWLMFPRTARPAAPPAVELG